MKITQNTPEYLTVDDRPWLIGVVILGLGLIFGAIGAVMLMQLEMGGIVMLLISGLIFFAGYWLIERTQVVFNRPDNWVEIRKKSMRRMKVTRFNLGDVDSTTAEIKASSGSDGVSKTVSRIILVVSDQGDQRSVPFTGALSSGGDAERISPLINDWLATG